MKTILLTGGAGFLGSILKKQLLTKNYQVVSIDLKKDPFKHPNYTAIVGDIRQLRALEKLFKKYRFTAIYHFAAMMPHAVKNRQDFWRTNVDGTQHVAALADRYRVPRLIFASTNCLWGQPVPHPITEDHPIRPREIYGRSKAAAESILASYASRLKVIIFRCPPIIDATRAGLISIMFDFIRENRKLWLVGQGTNRYQLLYAGDCVAAMLAALSYQKSAVFNLGSDQVPTFREMYQQLIEVSGSKSRPASLPIPLIRPAMSLARHLKLSPLSPYTESMLHQTVILDTTKAKRALKWRPTLDNTAMLVKSYSHYTQHRSQLTIGTTNQDLPSPGLIKLLKWIS